MPFTKYIALGDSVSIDLYPALDAGEIDVAVALEGAPSAGNVAPLGAASLLFKKSEERWTEDTGDDISSMYSGIKVQTLTSEHPTLGEGIGDHILHDTATH